MRPDSIESYLASYEKIKEQTDEGIKFFIEFYHQDDQGEPFLFTSFYSDRIKLDHVSGHGMIINIFSKEITASFSQKKYNTNVSDGSVVFSSKNDVETYCVIDFG